MADYLPTRPGWYRNPDDPGSLRYWDGEAWTARSRQRPPWSTGAVAFTISDHDLDRSSEGPVHPRELREPVASASGAWGRDWLAWRPRHVGPGWQRRGAEHAESSWVPARPQAPARFGPARWPVVALLCLVVVSVGVVLSSVAVISPYETKQAADQGLESRFAIAASKDCEAALPKDRAVLTVGTDGPAIAAAAAQVELLRRRLAALHAAEDLGGPVSEWLDAMQGFAQAESQYAALLGSPAHGGGAPAPRKLAAQAAAGAEQAHGQVLQWAATADRLSASLQLGACRLQPEPPA